MKREPFGPRVTSAKDRLSDNVAAIRTRQNPRYKHGFCQHIRNA